MSLETSHLLDIEAEPPFLPEKKPDIDEHRFLAGDGLGVVYSGGDVMFSLADDVTRKMQAIEEFLSAQSIQFGYAVTVEVSADNPGIGTVNIAAGLIYDMSYTAGRGWYVREHEVPAGTIGNVTFPCLIYGRVELTSVTSLQDGVFNGSATIEGRVYTIEVETATKVRQIGPTAIPAFAEGSPSIFQYKLDTPDPLSSYFQFRVADIDSTGVVTTQYAIGSVTLPNTATPAITLLSIV